MRNLILFILLIFCILSIQMVNSNNSAENKRSKQSRKYRSKLSKLFTNSEYKNELKPNYWTDSARLSLINKLSQLPNFRVAKNVIFFMGDGMSIPTITASRIYRGQKQGRLGENSKLFFEDFPFTGLVKTYCVDRQVADSACAATAFLCGVKSNFATIGVTPNVQFNDCAASMNKSNHLNSLAMWAQKAGKGTGIVTTTRVTHASPAGNYAYVANRGYECDADVIKRYKKSGFCQDIASQLIFNNPGKNFNVIMGGGRKKFLPNNKKDEEGHYGQRLQKIDLIDAWKNQKKSLNLKYEYIYNRSALNSVNYLETDYLLGLFNTDHMQFNLDNDHEIEPTLAEMTEAAIKLLKKYRNGFYLFVEGGNIDLAHHNNYAQKALDETVEFDKAIEVAARLTSREDTLIVVTADHAHVMTMSGYADRGQSIFGTNKNCNTTYTTLSYANGPSAKGNNTSKSNNSSAPTQNRKYPAMVYLKNETHGGDDVSIYAIGPWAHLFTGVYEQNVIPHLIGFASCIGNGPSICRASMLQ